MPRSLNPSPAALTRAAFICSRPLDKNKKQIPEKVSAFLGTPKGTRTPDLLIRSG